MGDKVHMRGVGASNGVAIGPAFVVSRTDVTVPDVADPLAAFRRAAIEVKGDLDTLGQTATQAGKPAAAAILGAQALIAEDPMLDDAVAQALDAGAGLQQAIEAAGGELSAMLAAMPDEYLAARSADVLEVADRILRRLAGVDAGALDALTKASIVVAPALTAAETANLDPDLVLGFVTEEGGATSHVAVIARSLGMPAVVGIGELHEAIPPGATIGIDGGSGEVVVDPDAETLAELDRRRKQLEQSRTAAARFKGQRVVFGGRPMSVAANVGGPDDVTRAHDAAADGVGLYRTEFLFLDRSEPPSEEEQVARYTEALEAFADPVVVRTFDIGGDKPAPYLTVPDEANPFLGVRGVRIYGMSGEIIRTQLRALLRASVNGDLWIMVPMIATIRDILEVKTLLDDLRRNLEGAGIAVGNPKLGVMIEVPSAALIAAGLAPHVDFFSIGTNDLTQYTMAADRMNGRLIQYSDAAHPAVLRLCHLAAQAARVASISVSVCGEAAADPILAVLFAAMGIDKLSVAPPSVDLVKSYLATVDADGAGRLLTTALGAHDAETVRAVVGEALGSPT